MTLKHTLHDVQASPRRQKKATPESSSRESSPYFSAQATSPIGGMPGPFSPLPPLDPAMATMPETDDINDTDDSNYTTSLVNTAAATIAEMQDLAMPHESVEEHILSVTPAKSTADIAPDDDMLELSPPSIDFWDPSIDSDEVRNRIDNLGRLPESERQAIWREMYENQEIELHSLRPPELCELLPEHAAEIFKAYCFHITVIVKVWTNYDSVEKKFYLDEERFETCGKLLMSTKQLRSLKKYKPNLCQFSKVHMNVGTPFRTLVALELHATGSDTGMRGRLDVTGKMVKDYLSPHHVLRDVVRRAMQNINDDGLDSGYHGITIQKLRSIALEFVFKTKNIVAKPRPEPEYPSRGGIGYGVGSSSSQTGKFSDYFDTVDDDDDVEQEGGYSTHFNAAEDDRERGG